MSLLCCCQFIDVGRALCYVGHPCCSSSQEKRSTHIRVVGPSPTVTIVGDDLIRTGIRLCIAHHSII